METLWPNDIDSSSSLYSPVTLLREQAALLGKRTRNLVIAEVVPIDISLTNYSEEFLYAFYIVAPTLNNYRYRLFTVSHPIDFYPVTFDLDSDIQAELVQAKLQPSKSSASSLDVQGRPKRPSRSKIGEFKAHTKEEYVNIIRQIFNSKKTKQVIQALLSMLNPLPVDATSSSG